MAAGLLVPQAVYVAYSFVTARTVAEILRDFAGAIEAVTGSVPLLPSYAPDLTWWLPAGIADLTLFADAYFGWGISIYCMVLGLVVTVGVSAATTQAPGEDSELYFEGLTAD